MFRLIRRFGASLVVAILATGCLYTMSSGGGLPSHIKTVAVIPFENETANSELTQEIHQELRKSLASRLGLREAPEARASLLVRGTVVGYEADVPVTISADPTQATSARRKLQLVVNIELIDQSTGRPIFERTGLSGEGEYGEREEAAGRKAAIQRIITDIVEGAQSQW